MIIVFQTQYNILNTKLKKILTSSDFKSNQEIIVNHLMFQHLPLKVTIKLDGISGINQNETFY